MSRQFHPYHIVSPSPWPALGGLSGCVTMFSAAAYMHGYLYGGLMLAFGLTMLIVTVSVWWRDVIRESTYQGHHTRDVQKGLKLGFMLFIISEALVFFGLFWAFFHSSLSPSVELGGVWPPVGIEVLNPWRVPLLNTIILLASGCTVTWAHHALVAGNRESTIKGLAWTILLGLIFTFIQGLEYFEAPFTISDSIYGTTFFMTTGLHGSHVIIGTIFLTVSLVRIVHYHFTRTHHVGFESAIIMWHFLDLVWLFVFATFYCWAS